MQVAGLTDTGRKRKNNEDYLIIDKELDLYIVCDGMGGYSGGEVASKEAAISVQRFIKKHQASFNKLALQNTPESNDELTKLVGESVQYACQKVYEIAQTTATRKGMGTTLTLLLIIAQKGVLAHVGDSRLYLERDGEIHRISKDHTFVDSMLKNGFTLEEALKSPYAHTITRAVGVDPRVEVDTLIIDILPRDTYLLCSDGLHNYLPNDSSVADLMKELDVESVVRKSIDFALSKGGKDNITALAIRAQDDTQTMDVKKTKQNRLKFSIFKRIELFQSLSLDELSPVMNACQMQGFKGKIEIIREGTPGDVLYVLLEGSVTLSRAGKVLCQFGPGSHFGEMALINNCPRSATVITNEDCLFLTLSCAQFEQIMQTQLTVANKILLSLAGELSKRLDEDTLERISR